MVQFVFDEFNARPAEFIVKNPADDEDWEFETEDGATIRGIIHVAGYDSKEFVNAARKFASSKEGKESLYMLTLTGTIDQKNAALIAKCIVGWEDNGFFSTPYTPSEAHDLVSRPENIWLLSQLAEFLSHRENFFRKK